MSSLTLGDEQLEKVPDMEILQRKFRLTLPERREDEEEQGILMEIIKLNNMAPWYELVCPELGWTCDEDLLTEMRANNEEALAILDEEIAAAQRHCSEIEVKDAHLSKASYLIKIGDKESALKVLGKAFSLTKALGYKLDNIFTCTRVGFFFLDHALIRDNLSRAQELVEMGANYDKKNRLKVYEGLYGLIVRDFATTARNFLGVVGTYTCSELLPYEQFISYAVFAAVLALPRRELEAKILRNSDIQQALFNLPQAKKYLLSLYDCEYAAFFECLAEVEQTFKHDCFLHPHYRFYVREMRLLAYRQLLVSYKSLTLAYMAEQFGVGDDFVENDLSNFIATGRIRAKIDLVRRIVIVDQNFKDRKDEQFEGVIRQGDLLLNSAQKLFKNVNKVD